LNVPLRAFRHPYLSCNLETYFMMSRLLARVGLDLPGAPGFLSVERSNTDLVHLRRPR
jgi:hypothetical protein